MLGLGVPSHGRGVERDVLCRERLGHGAEVAFWVICNVIISLDQPALRRPLSVQGNEDHEPPGIASTSTLTSCLSSFVVG